MGFLRRPTTFTSVTNMERPNGDRSLVVGIIERLLGRGGTNLPVQPVRVPVNTPRAPRRRAR